MAQSPWLLKLLSTYLLPIPVSVRRVRCFPKVQPRAQTYCTSVSIGCSQDPDVELKRLAHINFEAWGNRGSSGQLSTPMVTLGAVGGRELCSPKREFMNYPAVATLRN